MKHIFDFKDTDNFGHILYNIAEKIEKGYDGTKKKGYYSIYMVCSQKQMDTIIKKSVAYKIKTLKDNINEKQKEIIELCSELANFPFEYWQKNKKGL